MTGFPMSPEILRFNEQVHGFERLVEPYTFSYDETGNIRKLLLRGDSFNVAKLDTFVLGGLAYPGAPREFSIRTLRRRLHLQPSTQEVKAKHIYKGDFTAILGSKKLLTLLEWIEEESLLLHYQHLDPLFFSLVDIIDSIIMANKRLELLPLSMSLKSDLTFILRPCLREVARLMTGHRYPSVPRDRQQSFLDALMRMVLLSPAPVPNERKTALISVLREGFSLQELPFIEGNGDDTELIDSFGHFYSFRFSLFENCYHRLDEEPQVQGFLAKYLPTQHGVDIRFIESGSDPLIQLSDTIVGVIGRLYDFVKVASWAELKARSWASAPNARANLDLLSRLVRRSIAVHPAFVQHLSPIQDIENGEWVLDSSP